MSSVEFTILLEMHDWSREELLNISSMIKSRNIGDPISKKQLLGSFNENADDSIDMLIFAKILSSVMSLKVCCEETILYDGDVCDFCFGKNKPKDELYYSILSRINSPEDLPGDLHGSLKLKVESIIAEISFLLGCTIFSLSENPLCDKDKLNIERNYQFLGYRVLYPYFDVDMERLRSGGRTDLLIKKRGINISYLVEFKVWKSIIRENYVDQCLNYFDSNSVAGFIYTVNTTKKSIWEEYINQQIKLSAFWIEESGIEKIVSKDSNKLDILKSIHKCPVTNKISEIYHFIYDLHASFEGRS